MTNVFSTNPFRTPQLSRQNTNASINSRAGVGDTPISPTTVQNLNDNNSTIPDEAPPPYTLSADMLEGEIPIQISQEPPLPDVPPPQIFNSVPANIAQPSITINSRPEPSEPRNPPPAPPPRHPSTISTITTSSTTPSRRSASVSSPISPVSPIRSRSDRLSVSYLPPSGPPPSERRSQIYDPPSDPPPRRAVSASSRSVTNNSNSNSNNNVSSSRPIDDGRPTTTPVPGHPLLFQNKLLVYPSGYECSQCKNVGYRNNDPSHPCTKCWSKYARSYSGALAYAPFPSPSENRGSSNFQRPLPRLQPPHGTGASSSSSPPSSSRPATQKPPARLRRRSQSVSNLNGGNVYNSTSPSMSSLSSSRISTNTSSRTSVPQSPVSQSQRHSSFTNTHPIPPRPSPRTIQPSPHPPPSQRSSISTNRSTSCISTRPSLSPRGSVSPGGRPIIYQAGDPRIGGRLCWRCDGKGNISYFLFDSTICEVCGGIGRTFN